MTSKSSKTVQHKSTKSGSKNGRRGGQTSKAAQSKGRAAKSPLKLPFRRAKRRSSPVVQPRQSRQAAPTAKAVRQGMTLDRKLDIIGIFLVLVGLLTGLSLLSATNSPLTGSWVSGLRKAFGLGAYLFPGTLIVAGLWLVLRNFERIPRLGLERLLGIGLLFFNILAGLHFLMLLNGETSSQELAQSGGGGGYTGALIYQALVAVLGTGGAAVALLAWLMIALLLILDVTVLEIAHRLSPWWLRLRDGVEDMWQDFRTGSPRSATDTRSTLLNDGFTPTGEHPLAEEGLAAGDQLPTSTIPPELAAAGSPFASSQPPRRLWILPSVENILEAGSEATYDDTADERRSQIIEDTLASFGAPVKVVEINRGPTITQFGVEPDFIESRGGRMRVRVGKIAALADDLALALSARTIRIQAPVPGKGFVGIEVPNDEIALVALRDVIESEAFKRLKSPLRFALGLNVSGNARGRRPGGHAAPADRRRDRLGQVGVRQRADLLPAAAQHARRPAPGHGGPQARGADRLQRHPAPAGAGGGGAGAGGRRAAVGDARDGHALPQAGRSRLPQHPGIQQQAAGSAARRNCPTWW